MPSLGKRTFSGWVIILRLYQRLTCCSALIGAFVDATPSAWAIPIRTVDLGLSLRSNPGLELANAFGVLAVSSQTCATSTNDPTLSRRVGILTVCHSVESGNRQLAIGNGITHGQPHVRPCLCARRASAGGATFHAPSIR